MRIIKTNVNIFSFLYYFTYITERITLRPWLDTDVKALYNNPASGRVMEKCGFRPTGETAFDSKLYHGYEQLNNDEEYRCQRRFL